MQRNGLKPTCPKFWMRCPVLNRESILDGWDLLTQINDTYAILNPPCLSTFKLGGGGGPESGAHLSNGSDRHAQINGDEGNSGPPRLSTFKRRGGGVRNRRTQLFDGQIEEPRSMGSCASSFSATLPLILCGPFSHHVIFLSTFLLLPCVIHPPPFLVRMVLPPSHHPLTACHVSRSFPRQPLAKEHPVSLSSSPSACFLHPCLPPLSPPHTSPLLFRPPHNMTPSPLPCAPFSALAAMPIHQALRLFQVAA
jgi:hypothetical protein